MTSLSITTGKNAKTGGEPGCPRSAADFTRLKRISAILKAYWPTKTASKVAYITGVSERCVKFWLAGETRMSLENVAALLKTEAGYDLLEAVLGSDCKAEWWLVTQTAQDVRKMRREIKKQEDQIALRRAQIDMIDQLKK